MKVFFVVVLDITRLLLAENVHWNIVNELGDSSLHGAMFGNKVKIVDLLIKAGRYMFLKNTSK